jgi:hypothetical protein
MALISGPECNHQISDKTDVCQHCAGTPKRSGFDIFIWTAIAAIGGFCMIAKSALGVSTNGVQIIDKVAEQEAQNPTCISNWHKCRDMSELMNSYRGMSYVRAHCRSGAMRMAMYGEPKLPGPLAELAFNTYPATSTDFLRTGILRLVELDAQYQNGRGIYVRSPVECIFDLSRKEVVDLSIKPVD